MKKRSKKFKIIRAAVISVCVLTVIGCVCAMLLDPYFGTADYFVDSKPLSDVLTPAQAVSDLDYIYGKVGEKHPAFLEDTTLPAELKAQYEAERAALSAKGSVTVLELWQSASRMLAVMHDGHTRVSVYADDPLYIDGAYSLPDAALTAVDGVKTAELCERFKTMYFYEKPVEFYAESVFEWAVLRESYLNLLGIDTSDGVDFTFDNGETAHYGLVPVSAFKDAPTEELPLCSYTVDDAKSLGIFTLNDCTVNDEYKNTLAEFFGKVIAGNIANVAVDLRANGGGNSQVIDEFYTYLDVDSFYETGGLDVRTGMFLQQNPAEARVNERKDEVFKGRLYVLTSEETFSSAMLFAETVADNGTGVLIGEIPGNMPASYGDILQYQTPEAKLAFTVSFKHFHRVDAEKDSEPIIPDYCVDASKALDKLYELIAA